MKPSEDEIRFARQRQKIWEFVVKTCSKVDVAMETNPVALSANVDSVVGPMLGHTLSGQQMVMKRTYLHTSGDERSFEISIGHTGQNWEPVITFLDENEFTFSLAMGEVQEMDLSELRANIYRRIEGCSGA